MSVTVFVDLHNGEIFRFLYSSGGPVSRGVKRWAQEVRAVAVINAPKDTGHLANANSVEMNSHPGFVVGVIAFNARHALWVHEGTGVYGRRGRPIRSRTGGLMKIPGRGRRATYVRTTRGQRPQPFLVSALRLVMLPKGATIRLFRVR